MRLGISLSLQQPRRFGAPSPTAPVLSVVEPVTDPPSFTAVIDDTVGSGDSYQLQMQADGGDWSTLLVDDTDTITSGEDAANEIDATVSALGAGNYDARMRVRDGSGPWSSWSNVVDVVIEAAFDADAETIFAAFTTPPSDPRKAAINTLVTALKTAGVWTKMGVLYVFAAADSQAAKINWKNPGTLDASEVSTPTFTTDVGYNSNGSSTSLTVGAAYGSIPGITQNDNHLGAFFSGTVGGNLWGRTDSNGRFSLGAPGSSTESRLASSSAFNSGTASAGHLVAVRRGASEVEHYNNGSSIATGTTASTDVGSGNARLLFSNGGYASSGTVIRIAHAGSALSDTEVADIDSAFDAYLGAL